MTGKNFFLKNNLLGHETTAWNSNVYVHKSSFIGTQPSRLIDRWSRVAFLLKWQRRVAATETVLPGKPQIFTLWLFIEETDLRW